MPLRRLEWAAGFNSQATQTKNNQGWFSCNLVRWRNGLLEKLAGWQRLFNTTCAGTVRCLHAYLDLLNTKDLIIAGDGGVQIYNGTTLFNTSFLRRVVSVANSGGITLTPASGTKVLTVTDNAHGAAVGDTVTFPITFTIGGLTLIGPNTFTVQTVTNANNYTLQLPSNALNSTSATLFNNLPQFTFTNATTASVQLTAHGFSASQQFVVQAGTIVQALVNFGFGTYSFNLPAGTSLLINSITDTNNFIVNLPAGQSWASSAGPQTFLEGVNNSVSPTTFAPAIQYTSPGPSSGDTWFLDNFGNFGLVLFAGGPLYVFTPPATSSTVLANAGQTSSPQVNNGMLVAMPQAQVILFGSAAALSGSVIDPLLLRWSEVGSFTGSTDWTASSINQAGSFRLGGSGTRIVGGIQAPQTTLIWTDQDLWSMTYSGPPFIYNFSPISSGCGLVGPHAMALLGRTCLWMSQKGFFVYSDSGVSPVSCPVWDVIFNDIDQTNISKVFLGTSSQTHEIWCFYPSISGNTGECDKYVKVNIVENLWDFGTLNRTAWLQENAFGAPLASDTTLLIQQHETGYDADGAPMTGVFAETGYADLSDGEEIMVVDEFIPDSKWFGTEGAMSVTMYGVMYPGDKPVTKGPYGVDQYNKHIRPRMRARQIALRFDWIARTGFSARLGTPRANIIKGGRRP